MNYKIHCFATGYCGFYLASVFFLTIERDSRAVKFILSAPSKLLILQKNSDV